MNPPGVRRPAGARFSLKLKTKLQLSFLVIGFLSIAGTGWQAFESARSSIESITFDHLTSIRDTKKRQIESYFRQTRDQVVTLSEDRMVAEAAGKFIGAFRRVGVARRDSLAALLRSGGEAGPGAVADYRRIDALYHPILENYLRRFGYEDIFIIDPDSGFVAVSVQRKPDFATNLLAGPFSATNLADVFREAGRSRAPETSVLVDFSPYAASRGAPASFIASPIVEGDRIVAVLVVQISIALINEVMTSNNNWQAEGLGVTGETYIVGADFRMRTDSRFFIQEPEEYFRRLQRTGTSDTLIQKIRQQKTSILLQEVRTDATVDALKGNTDTKIIRDYRGIPVLSSYTPLQIPGVQWVMLSEIDTSEAFKSVQTLRERLILLGLVILLVAALVGALISRTISRPILSLAKATAQFGKGNLPSRADVLADDEIGLLARTFNGMAESITLNTRQLENEIAERRRAEEEVTSAHHRLRNLSAHLQTVREEERKALAREIHDELGQALTTLKLNLTLLKDEYRSDVSTGDARVSSMMAMIDATLRAVRGMITALRPGLLDDLGLTAAIEWQVEEFQQRTGIGCTVSIVPEDISPGADLSTTIFRILQETLTNVARHAKATSVTVRLEQADGAVELRVEDDGIGITEEQANDSRAFGLIGIRERASYWGGRADIQGTENRGTAVTVRLPQAQGRTS